MFYCVTNYFASNGAKFTQHCAVLHSMYTIITLKPSRCIEASFYIPENRLNFPLTKDFRTKISMKLVHQYIAFFCNFQTTSNHLHPIQVENCDSNSRLVVDEDNNDKFRFERVKSPVVCRAKPKCSDWYLFKLPAFFVISIVTVPKYYRHSIHLTLDECWPDVGTPSAMLAQH